METKTNPEAILFVRAGLSPCVAEHVSDLGGSGSTSAPKRGEQLVIHQPRSKRTWLCFTMRNHCFLHYIALPTSADSSLNPLTHQLCSVSLHRETHKRHQNAAARCEVAADDWSVHSFNTNPNPLDVHVSYSLLSLSLHPSSLYICVQTGDHTSPHSLSRLLLLPLLSSTRAATIWTRVATSSYAVPRHSWLGCGRACWMNAQDGVVTLVDLKGTTRAQVLAHAVVAHGQGESDAAPSWSRGANTIVKDVVVLGENEVASCGFDHTVRIITLDTNVVNTA